MTILPLYSPASSSSTGATARQGPHHGAQKSTMTGLSDLSTCCSKVSSVTAIVLVAMYSSLPAGRSRKACLNCTTCYQAVIDPVRRSAQLARGGATTMPVDLMPLSGMASYERRFVVVGQQ